MSQYRAYFVPQGADPLGLTCDPSVLAWAFVYHYVFGGKKQFPGVGPNWSYGSCVLKRDEGIRKAARAELLSMVSELCKKSTDESKRVWNELRPQPKSYYLLHTTNVPSRGFNLDIAYKSTRTKCCCKIDFDVKYFWQDRADLHFFRNGKLLFPDWIAYLVPVWIVGGGDYEINIHWKDKATYQFPIGENLKAPCKRIDKGWPLERVVMPEREGTFENVDPSDLGVIP
jgi:hypothetical protein